MEHLALTIVLQNSPNMNSATGQSGRKRTLIKSSTSLSNKTLYCASWVDFVLFPDLVASQQCIRKKYSFRETIKR